eukprot:6488694-Amphidinium_carterae.1
MIVYISTVSLPLPLRRANCFCDGSRSRSLHAYCVTASRRGCGTLSHVPTQFPNIHSAPNHQSFREQKSTEEHGISKK